MDRRTGASSKELRSHSITGYKGPKPLGLGASLTGNQIIWLATLGFIMTMLLIGSIFNPDVRDATVKVLTTVGALAMLYGLVCFATKVRNAYHPRTDEAD